MSGALPWGALAGVASIVGYSLEAVRQRGTCEFGDPTPDTLVASVLLIIVGAGLGGLVSVVAAVVGIIRNGWTSRAPHFVLAVLALASVTPLFAFAGSGPGSWFQYCAT